MWWGGVLAAALKRPLIYRDGSEVGPAYGAARLARIAKTRERAEDVCRPPPVRVVIEPNARDIERLAPKRKKFSQIYQDLRPRFRLRVNKHALKRNHPGFANCVAPRSGRASATHAAAKPRCDR